MFSRDGGRRESAKLLSPDAAQNTPVETRRLSKAQRRRTGWSVEKPRRLRGINRFFVRWLKRPGAAGLCERTNNRCHDVAPGMQSAARGELLSRLSSSQAHPLLKLKFQQLLHSASTSRRPPRGATRRQVPSSHCVPSSAATKRKQNAKHGWIRTEYDGIFPFAGIGRT